jgi:hypothetical protein
MFRLVDDYDTRRRGMRSKITGLFVYSFSGADPSARFDAGLVNPDGTPRKAFSVVAETARTRRWAVSRVPLRDTRPRSQQIPTPRETHDRGNQRP